MKFQVPQFIEVEDKIFGPLTLKQFIYLAGAGGVIFILYTFLPFFLVFLLGAPVIAFSAALAFYKVNDRPFVHLLEAAFNYVVRSRLYIWKKEERKPVAKGGVAAAPDPSMIQVPKLSESRLKDLAWSLDIKESSLYTTNKQR